MIWFVVNSTDFFENARAMPAQIRMTWGQYLSWMKDDNSWTGKWSGSPETYVDLQSLGLSSTDTEIVIWAEHGRIDGTIASRTVCNAFPLFNYVLLEGEVSGDAAEVRAFDYVAGRRIAIADLRFMRSGRVMTVEQVEGDRKFFPTKLTLANEQSSDPRPDQTYCAKERAAIQGWQE